MKHSVFLTAALLALFLTACGGPDISDELGVDTSGGRELSHLETHGGAHGDGTTFIALEFSDDAFLRRIEADSRWGALPPDETARALLYGAADETGSVGPYLTDDAGNALMPEVRNGYYLLVDRHAEAGQGDDLLRRASFNFTVAVYDADANILYIGKLDT